MANISEYAKYIENNRLDFIKLTDLQNKELARLYIEAAANIKAQAESIIDKTGLSYAQAKIRIKSLLLEAGRLSDGFKGILDKSLIDTANLSTEVNKIILGKYGKSLANEGVKVNFGRILFKVPDNAVKAVCNRIWNDGLKLSDRLWLTDRRTKQEIERIVMQNIVSGGSASNKATLSALDNLLNPEYTPAKLTSLHGRQVGYESSRLLRTSTMEAFNEGARMSDLANPGVSGSTWQADADACDECLANDGQNTDDVGFPPLHPNCRCDTLAKVESIEDFTNRWLEFMDNPNSQPDLGDWILTYGKAA